MRGEREDASCGRLVGWMDGWMDGWATDAEGCSRLAGQLGWADVWSGWSLTVNVNTCERERERTKARTGHKKLDKLAGGLHTHMHAATAASMFSVQSSRSNTGTKWIKFRQLSHTLHIQPSCTEEIGYKVAMEGVAYSYLALKILDIMDMIYGEMCLSLGAI